MNIYELKKQIPWPKGMSVASCEHIANAYEFVEGNHRIGMIEDVSPEMAAFAVHCINHFMEALEALKYDASVLNCIADTPDCGIADDRWNELNSLIQKLETVEN
jgi:hypothetical protein